MARIKYKYSEEYRQQGIFIRGSGRHWYWHVVINRKTNYAPAFYFSLKSAINNARKFIDRKLGY